MRALVVAKAPVPGRVKTRLGAVIGMETAARVAAAALLDTIGACRDAFDEWHLALDGDLRGACSEDALRDQLTGWRIHAQRGGSLGQRLARAHADAAGPGPTVQIGMDTPQVTAGDLRQVARASEDGNAVLGPAGDGGWWVLALRDPGAAEGLTGVRMSQSDTHRSTQKVLERAGLHVVPARMLRDVDTVSDADDVVGSVVDGNFRRAWREAAR